MRFPPLLPLSSGPDPVFRSMQQPSDICMVPENAHQGQAARPENHSPVSVAVKDGNEDGIAGQYTEAAKGYISGEEDRGKTDGKTDECRNREAEKQHPAAAGHTLSSLELEEDRPVMANDGTESAEHGSVGRPGQEPADPAGQNRFERVAQKCNQTGHPSHRSLDVGGSGVFASDRAKIRPVHPSGNKDSRRKPTFF